MTPNHLTGLVPMMPSAIALPEPLQPSVREGDYEVIAIGRNQLAQGPVTRRFRDGRVSVDAGGLVVTGHPLGTGLPKGLWARLSRFHA